MNRWKVDPFLLLIIVAGLAILGFKLRIAKPIDWIGGTDESVLAEAADSFTRGRGLSNDFIQYSYFYSPLQYPQITQPEAHYPHLYSLLIVPFYLLLGKTALAAKLPAMLVASILLPVFLYLLVTELSTSRLTGLAAGLSVMVFPEIFEHSLIPDDDGIFHCLLIASCFFIIRAMDNSNYFYPAGIFIGLSYYAKGNALILIPVYGFFCLIRGGFKILGNSKLWHCLAIILLIMIPWFIRNTIHFGSPTFSTQQYAAGYIGYQEWEEGTYSLYWNQDRPTLVDKLKQAGLSKVWQKSTNFLLTYLWWSFIDIDGLWYEFDAKKFYTYYTGIPAAIGLFLFFLANFYFLCRHLFFKDTKPDQSSFVHHVGLLLKPWCQPDFHLLWLVSVVCLVFLSICWEPIERLAYPFIVINMVLGWTTFHLLISQTLNGSRWSKQSNVITSSLMLALMLPILLKSWGTVYDDYQDGKFPYGNKGASWMRTGRWIKDNLPGSITMFREPAQLHFYSEEKTIQVPLAELDQIITVMKYYGVTHIIPKVNMRPALRPLVEGKIPGFKLIHDQGLEIYQIDYTLLPDN